MKLKFALFLYISLIGSCGHLLGQTDTLFRNAIQFSLGAIHHRLIDEGLSESRLKFSGNSFNINLSYQKMTEDQRLKGSFGFGSGDIKQNDIELEAALYNIKLDFSYAKRFSQYALWGKQSRLYLGLQISLFNYIVYDELILENVSVNFNYTLDMVILQTIKLNQRSYLEVELALPIVGFQKRDSADGNMNSDLLNDYENNFGRFLFSDSQFTYYNPFSLVRLRINYTFTITKKTDFTINYLFNYINSNDRLPISLYDNGLVAGFKFRF